MWGRERGASATCTANGDAHAHLLLFWQGELRKEAHDQETKRRIEEANEALQATLGREEAKRRQEAEAKRLEQVKHRFYRINRSRPRTAIAPHTHNTHCPTGASGFATRTRTC